MFMQAKEAKERASKINSIPKMQILTLISDAIISRAKSGEHSHEVSVEENQIVVITGELENLGYIVEIKETTTKPIISIRWNTARGPSHSAMRGIATSDDAFAWYNAAKKEMRRVEKIIREASESGKFSVETDLVSDNIKEKIISLGYKVTSSRKFYCMPKTKISWDEV